MEKLFISRFSAISLFCAQKFSKNFLSLYSIIDMPYYAVTITVSPYKKFNEVRYKDMTYEEQKRAIKEWLSGFDEEFFSLYRIQDEKCPTSGHCHFHLCVKPKHDHQILTEKDIMEVFKDTVVNTLGYNGRNNKPEHFIKIDHLATLNDFYRWEDYMYKLAYPLFIF